MVDRVRYYIISWSEIMNTLRLPIMRIAFVGFKEQKNESTQSINLSSPWDVHGGIMSAVWLRTFRQAFNLRQKMMSRFFSLDHIVIIWHEVFDAFDDMLSIHCWHNKPSFDKFSTPKSSDNVIKIKSKYYFELSFSTAVIKLCPDSIIESYPIPMQFPLYHLNIWEFNRHLKSNRLTDFTMAVKSFWNKNASIKLWTLNEFANGC